MQDITDLTVRTARREDLAALDALFARSYPVLLKADYPASVLVTAVPLISRAQPRLLATGTYYVAELDGRIAGAGGWTKARPGGRARRGVAHIRHFATDAALTRRGVGRALMLRVFEAARRAGIGRLHCMSTRSAVPFYAAMGFETLGERSVPLAPGIDFPAVAMTRRL